MFPRIRSLLIYATLVSVYSSDERCAEGASEFVGSVRNLSVAVLQDREYTERKDLYKFLKLNVSWLAPNSSRQPSSYSVIVTGIPSVAQCPEGSLFYTLKGKQGRLSAVLPEHHTLADIPDLYIQPNCSYKVQVIANPRNRYSANPPQVIYTLPECIGATCSCANLPSTLPIPKVHVTFAPQQTRVAVNWSAAFNASTVHVYAISIGVPLLTSKNGLPVYNITRLGQVPADQTTFLWNSNSSSGVAAQLKLGYKIIVNAVDYRGCLGREGSFVVRSLSPSSETANHRAWPVPVAIAASCILFAVLSFALYRSRSFLALGRSNNSTMIHQISQCKSQWRERILQKRNILYGKYESEEEYAEYIEETDKLKVPFKSVKLIRELGSGQFGRVYLGQLDDANNTLVAVKMCQQADAYAASETRQQFLKEIEIMRSAGTHPHLVRLVGYCVQPDKPICILLEYMQTGDLLTYLHGESVLRKALCSTTTTMSSETHETNKTNDCKSKRHINVGSSCEEETRNRGERWFGKMPGCRFVKFAREICAGMEHLESKGITHRDLAARNVLLGADFTVKICDFGLSRDGAYAIKNTGGKARRLPIRWMSPEALSSRVFSSKSDVWSFGVVLWEMSTLGDFPYSNVPDDQLLRYIVCENGRLEQPSNVPSDVYELMRNCWATQPLTRPNFTHILSELRRLAATIHTASNHHPIRTISNPCYNLRVTPVKPNNLTLATRALFLPQT